MKAVFTSSIILIHPPEPPPRGGDSPWIVRFFEIDGKTRLYHPLYETPLPNIHEYLRLHNYFHPCHLALCYHLAETRRFDREKVLVFDIDFQSVLVLSNWGQLRWFKQENNHGVNNKKTWFDITYESVNMFDDILCFKGIIYALDRCGRLYQISPNNNKFGVEISVVIDKPVVKSVSEIRGWRKRLVGSSLDESIYLLVRDDFDDGLRVYKMKVFNWIEVDSFVDDDQILFLSRNEAYFAVASEFSVCNLKNCILFYDAFPSYFHMGRKFSKKGEVEEEIQVFWLGRNTYTFKPISSYPEFPVAGFFSPPSWVLKAHTSSNQFRSGIKKEVTEQGKSSEEDNDVKGEEAPDHTLEKKVFDACSAPVTPSLLALCEKCYSSTVKFKGVDIKSDILPTLETIWAKHGSLFCDKTVHSKDLRACALELLAKLMITLQNTTGRSLTESQADEMRWMVSDLQRIGFKVDWLAPTVEKALKFSEIKPVVESITALDKKRTRIELEEREFISRSAKMKKEIEENLASLSAGISTMEIIDHDPIEVGMSG